MDSRTKFRSAMDGLYLAFAAAALAWAAPASAQTHFIDTVGPSAAPVFQNLASFSSPTGAGTTRTTFIKLVTNAASPSFQIQRSPGVTAQVVADAPPDADDNITEGAAETLVASVLAVTAAAATPFCSSAPPAAGYLVVCIIVQYGDGFDFTAGPETWQLNVLEDGASAFEYFGWVGDVATEAPPFAAAQAAVTRSKIAQPDPVQFGGVHTDIGSQFAPVLAPDVRNVGTAPLTITGGPISNDPAPGFFDREVFTPSAVSPGGHMASDYSAGQGIWISATPTALGARTGTLTLQSATESVPVDLVATGVTLYSQFLLDCSGSMERRPDGSTTSVETETRLFRVKQAATKINNWIDLFSNRRAYTGLSTFPDCTSGSTQGKLWVSIDESISNHADIDLLFGLKSVAGLPDGGWTPMQSGIQVARADMNARISNGGLEPNAADRPNLRQAILLLSDGDETDGSAANEVDGLATNGIRLYTVGYGSDPATVNFDLLESLADGTGGEFFDANALDFNAVADAFKNAVSPWLGLQSVADPVGRIRARQTATHSVCIDPDAFGATFVVEWDRVAQNGITFTVTSPSGEVITPSTPGVSFFSEPTFGQYVIRGDRVRGGNGAGEWRMNLTGTQALPANQDTEYAWSALAQTPLEVAPVRNFGVLTAAPYLIEMQFVGWTTQQLGSATVSLDFDAPAESFGTYLARSPIDPTWVFGARQVGSGATADAELASLLPLARRQQTAPTRAQVPDSLLGEPASIAQRKAWALANLADLPFTDRRRTGTLQLVDDGTNGDRVAGDGIFTAQMAEVPFEGAYRYAVSVRTPNLTNACINRDVRFTHLAEVALSAALIEQHMTWLPATPELFFDPAVARELTSGEVEQGFVRSAAVFTPVDELGNHWGPGRAGDVTFAVTDGRAVGAVVDNWDGTYIQVVEHQRGTRPSVTIDADGVTSLPIAMAGGFSVPWWVWLLLLVIAVVVFLVRRS